MRSLMLLGSVAGLLLAGCGSPVPDSNLTSVSPDMVGGAQFGDYAAYELDRARREAALTGAAPGSLVAAPYPVAAAPLATAPLATASATPTPSGISTTDLAAVGIGSGIAPLAADYALAGSPTGGVAPAATVPGDVQGFPAVIPANASGSTPGSTTASASSALPTTPLAPVASSAAVGGPASAALPGATAAGPAWNPDADPLRDHGLEAQPGNAAPVLVTAPAVGGVADTGPNLVEYALNAPNTRGQEYYSRFAFAGEGRMQRNCASYRTPDEAQRDFLTRGGPDRDARGLDPDGDGFACGWDPAPFRAAVGR